MQALLLAKPLRYSRSREGCQAGRPRGRGPAANDHRLLQIGGRAATEQVRWHHRLRVVSTELMTFRFSRAYSIARLVADPT